MYLGETYNRYFSENGIDLYTGKKVDLPMLELYVIYTGDRMDVPESISMKKEFFYGEKSSVDVNVKVLTGGSDDIISQYVTFSKVITDMVRKHGRTRKAVEEAI